MSISALFGSRIVVPNSSFASDAGGSERKVAPKGGVVIECSSRPQKKATAHHMKTRPRKSQPWDIKRRPTVYAPLPPLPPDYTLATAPDETDTSLLAVTKD
ncbi:hypothetical protein HHK36_009685 [Tetracentron sinense]|uniref:50S ribosomal protein 6, chloroplastic n=1 Tax=Tetracentron sinense TaxID=13715 RepID=A0A834ZJF3_TETSI|nr:hypothetical protein HHK36_009685 [Tetracentron sinense]